MNSKNLLITNKPLVTIIIVSYKNYNYLQEAIDSVLIQDYPNIELIISNDGSDDFNKKAIEIYLKKHSNKNIKKIIVNNNKINLGTVKNINNAIKLSKGDYIICFAADDAMYDNRVVTNFVKTFLSLPKKELIVISQIGMYDIKNKKLSHFFITNENKQKIIKLKPKNLFSELAISCIIPGVGICYKKDIFQKYGFFNERYRLVEDYPSSLKYCRLNIRFNYSDFISFKHRDGGVSHGNIIGNNSTSKKYELDMINIIKYEIIPYFYLLNNKAKLNFIKILFTKITKSRIKNLIMNK